MNKAELLSEIMELPRDERVELIEDVWNSMIDDQAWMPTHEQLAEARRRLNEHRHDPSTAIPVERILARLQSRFG